MAADDQEERLSDDPDEQLRIENELLKLKLQAELGSEVGSMSDIPPELENAFLKQVLNFAQLNENAKLVTVHHLVGAPEFIPHDLLSDADIARELQRIEKIMEAHNVMVSYQVDYAPRTKYFFITEELFFEEVMCLPISEVMLHFVYEDFHPTHAIEVYDCALLFVEDWFMLSPQGAIFNMFGEVLQRDGVAFDATEVARRLRMMFDCFVGFDDVFYDLNVDREDPETGGRVTGTIGYTGILESGEEIRYEGTMQLELQYTECRGWYVQYFEMPGFTID